MENYQRGQILELRLDSPYECDVVMRVKPNSKIVNLNRYAIATLGVCDHVWLETPRFLERRATANSLFGNRSCMFESRVVCGSVETATRKTGMTTQFSLRGPSVFHTVLQDIAPLK